jgi:hypothetical protein
MASKIIAIISLVIGLVGCSSATNIGDAGDDDPDGDLFPDGDPWPDSGHWWPDSDPADVGPVCPDDGGVLTNYQCDVFEQDCPEDLACYGYIDYEEGECNREIYSSICLTPGLGRQGDPCDSWCQVGFDCFVTGSGTQCLAVCDIIGGTRTCPPGLICTPTDLPDVGACH